MPDETATASLGVSIEAFGELARPAERHVVAAVHLIGLDPETLAGVALAQSAVNIRSSRHSRYRVGTSGQASRGHGSRSARLLVTLPSPGLGCELRRDVVVEDVVVPARDVAGVRPPVVGSSPGGRTAATRTSRSTRRRPADERRGERAERMADDDHVPSFADRADDLVRVVAPACGWVLARKVDRHRLVPALAQLGDDQMPVPRAAAAAVDQDEGRHERAG